MKKHLTILLIFLFGILQSSAQNTTPKAIVSNNYIRSSLTIVFLNFNAKDKYSNDLKLAFEKLAVPDKYFDNQLDVKFITPSFDMRSGTAGKNNSISLHTNQKPEPEKMAQIGALLKQEKIAHKILAKWFDKTLEGKFDMDLVYERGLYSATDAKFNDASKSHRGASTVLKDAGHELIGRSYVMVLDFGNIQTMDEYSDEWDDRHKFLGVYLHKRLRMQVGFTTDIKTYLFKLEESAADKVYEMWENGSKFDQTDFPLTPVTQIFYPLLDGFNSKYNRTTTEEYFKKLTLDGIVKSEMMLSKNFEDFRVKSSVFNSKVGFNPNLTANIGLKEGVKLDDRYFVYEKVQGTEGHAKFNQVGVVRATNKIVDNRVVTDGSSGLSKFYQVQGKNVGPGMLIQQRVDFQKGWSFGMGYALGDYEHPRTKAIYNSPLTYMIRYDRNVSPFLSHKFGKWFSETRFYIELKMMGGSTLADSLNKLNVIATPLSSNKTNWAFGISKDMHILRNIKLAPFGQAGVSFASAKESFKTAFQFGYGVRLPISVLHWLEVVPTFTMYTSPWAREKVELDKILLSPMYIDLAVRMSF